LRLCLPSSAAPEPADQFLRAWRVIKAEPKLKDMALVKYPRLGSPVPDVTAPQRFGFCATSGSAWWIALRCLGFFVYSMWANYLATRRRARAILSGDVCEFFTNAAARLTGGFLCLAVG
jgi:hypothetical protein